MDFGAIVARFFVTSGSICLRCSRFGWGLFAPFDVLAHRGVWRARSLPPAIKGLDFVRPAPSPLQRCFLRSWGSCLLPCSAACAKPRASGHMPHPPFSPVQRSERRSISSCCRRASHRGALPATCLRTAERFAFVLRRPSPLPAPLYIQLLPTCFASRSVAGNVLAHRGALRIRAASAFPLAAPLARSHGPRATCCTPRSPP